ncbi:hypothetical protein GCM10018779_33630 [Streptomyces griseocarneus]|nr:hypothetical protein GCM10018779_33630 [Streptomyces griseocarneus]
MEDLAAETDWRQPARGGPAALGSGRPGAQYARAALGLLGALTMPRSDNCEARKLNKKT